MEKYFYIDENGNRKYYVGKIINDVTNNETYGILTREQASYKEVELEYHPAIKAEEGWSSYMTYIDDNGNLQKYNSEKYKKDLIDNSYFFTKVVNDKIRVTKHDKVDYKPGYFTYIDQYGKEIIYEGIPKFDKRTNTYYFIKK